MAEQGGKQTLLRRFFQIFPDVSKSFRRGLLLAGVFGGLLPIGPTALHGFLDALAAFRAKVAFTLAGRSFRGRIGSLGWTTTARLGDRAGAIQGGYSLACLL